METHVKLNPGLAIQHVLQNHSFRNLWLGQMFSQLAVNMMLFALGLRIYQTTSSNAAVSILFLCYGIPSVLFGMLAGAVVDRLVKRNVLIVCNITRAVMVFVLLFFSDNITIIYVLAFLNAVITQFYVPAEAPIIPKIVSAEYLVSANSLFSFTFYTSMAVGFILAGPLLRLAGPHFSFVVISVLFLFASYNASRVSVIEEKKHGLRQIMRYNVFYLIKHVIQDLKQGIRSVLRSKSLFDAIVLLSGTQIVMSILGTLGPGFADRILHIDVRDVSFIILGPAVLGIILGSLWVGTYGLRFRPSRLITTGVVSGGIVLIIIALLVRFQQSVPAGYISLTLAIGVTVFLFFLLGIANSLLDVPANTLLQQHADGDMRGRVYGILTAAVGGIGILPVVLGGILADFIGIGRVLFILGCLVCVYGIGRIHWQRT